MTKRKLSLRQQRQVNISSANQSHSENAELGRVITNYGKQCLVLSAEGRRVMCDCRQNLMTPTAGDWVFWLYKSSTDKSSTPSANGVVVAIKPVSNELTRYGFRNEIKRIAANIDLVFVVAAVVPRINLDLIDRYLGFCEFLELESILLLNKVDLQHDATEVNKILKLYEKVGYTVIKSSAMNGTTSNINQLLTRKTGIFVGESGVGKSSLINGLTTDTQEKIKTAPLSNYSGLGTHTTTHSVLHTLSHQGCVIDSPGIRELTPTELNSREIAFCYKEFNAYMTHCKFSSCHHLAESNCAVKLAVERGEIAASRYHSYSRWMDSIS